MSDTKKKVCTPTRRTALLQLTGAATLAATGLPKSRTKPVVDSVILPAHAVTSEVAADDGMMPGESPPPVAPSNPPPAQDPPPPADVDNQPV